MTRKYTKRKYKQGIFAPQHPNKYKGSHPIVYRSSLELAVMQFFDTRSFVKEWGSETIIIPYIKPTDGKVHKYYTDFNVNMVDKHNKLYKYLVEVKPYKQTIPPTVNGNKKQKTILTEQLNYGINCAKWESATEWCNKHGYKFTILTEKDIKKFIK